jgi:hypothetical protein
LTKTGKPDKTNQDEAKRILNKYGYPGYSLVGESGSSRYWAIVQHCDDDVAFQQKVLLLMKKEVDRKNASGENYAYLKDRVLTNLKQNNYTARKASATLKRRNGRRYPSVMPPM